MTQHNTAHHITTNPRAAQDSLYCLAIGSDTKVTLVERVEKDAEDSSDEDEDDEEEDNKVDFKMDEGVELRVTSYPRSNAGSGESAVDIILDRTNVNKVERQQMQPIQPYSRNVLVESLKGVEVVDAAELAARLAADKAAKKVSERSGAKRGVG